METNDLAPEFKTHDMKILPRYFEGQISGRKNFEIRKDDRDFKAGDMLHLREIDGSAGKECQYTGRSCKVWVTYVLSSQLGGHGFEGLEEGYSILSTEMFEVFV